MAYSKDDIRYWQNKGLFKDTFRTKDGELATSPNWSARIMHQGKHVTFPLKTGNRADAASRAREIYRYLMANGWMQTLEKFKPEKAQSLRSEIRTVGDFFEALEKRAEISPKTLEGYAQAFRTILGAAFHVPNGGGGNRVKSAKWRHAIYSIKLSQVTPARIAEWKKAFLARKPADTDPLSQKKASISVNSLLRRARALFAPKYLKHLAPVDNPFKDIELEKRQPQHYRSRFNVFKLIEAANRELASSEPELFKIFCLASMAGLRRDEIDKLEWSAFRWDEKVIRIEATRFHKPKTEGDIEIDDELIELFREIKSRTPGNFVLQSASHVQPKPQAPQHYRCASLFDMMVAWLRAKGLEAEKPLHELRKEFGSQLADKHGIYVASRMLRHSDIGTTASHYLDKKTRKTVGLGRLLKSAPVPEEKKVIKGNF